jgi:hypothetical protein
VRSSADFLARHAVVPVWCWEPVALHSCIARLRTVGLQGRCNSAAVVQGMSAGCIPRTCVHCCREDGCMLYPTWCKVTSHKPHHQQNREGGHAVPPVLLQLLYKLEGSPTSGNPINACLRRQAGVLARCTLTYA